MILYSPITLLTHEHSYGEDPQHVSLLGVAYLLGLQGMAQCTGGEGGGVNECFISRPKKILPYQKTNHCALTNC